MKTVNSIVLAMILLAMLVFPQNVNATPLSGLQQSPSILVWENKPDMPTARYGMATAVSNNKIYVIGGDNWSCTPLTNVEEFDPTTNAWSIRTNMPTGRWSLGAATGPDGKIYTMGGMGGACGSDMLDVVEVYDPSTDSWETRTSMPTLRVRFGMAAATNGKIYVFGGEDSNTWFATVEEYDPAQDTWTRKGDMPYPNKSMAVTAANNGKIYLLGGDTIADALLEYDPETDSWISRATVPTSRYSVKISQGSDGRIYAIGGVSLSDEYLSTVESYDPLTDTWRSETGLQQPRSGHVVVTMDQFIYAIGGGWRDPDGNFGPINSVEAGTITSLPPMLYAKQDGLTSGSCDSWANACNLQYALTSAIADQEIWVAAGVYKPTTDPTDRAATFQLKSGVELYGGFAGTETARDERNWGANKTILSGDIDNNDVNDDGNFIVEKITDVQGGNSYHVVVGSGTDNTSVLDGFIITAGQATSSYPNYGGGGLFSEFGNPTLTDITFSGNLATYAGGGMYIYSSKIALTNIIFFNNSAIYGGGMANFEPGPPTLTNVTFYGNSATYGGSIYNMDSDLFLMNSLLWGNDDSNGLEVSGQVHYIAATYSNIRGGLPGIGNINSDPLFVDAANSDLHLQAGSPAIDSGTNAVCPTTDFDGAPRMQDGNNDGIFKCDMGAFEFPGVVPPSLPPVADAGGPYTANKGETVTLDASNSSDPEGGVLTYGWDLNNDGQYDDATGVTPETSFANAGNLTIGLRVTDSDGLSDTDTAEVTIKSPPPNDNFNDATPIGSLPFSDLVDITNATTEPGEPQYCYSSPKTVWYSFTPNTNMWVQVDMFGSNFWDAVFNVYQATGPNITDLSGVQCAGFGNSASFTVQAGTTYYIQAGSYYGNNGNLQLNLARLPSPANDDFENATQISSLPFDNTVDTQYSLRQADEPTPSCAYFGPGTRSVWYAFTPTTSGSVSASIPTSAFTPLFAVYTGNSLVSLTQVGCQSSNWNLLTFHVDAGTTYYFQVGNDVSWEPGGSMRFHLDVAPQPVASFSYNPYDPSTFDTIQFYNQSYDPGQVGFQSFAWDFGDGTSTTASNPTHTYSADGDYTVKLTVTTYDGRTATNSQVVHVKTHDVGITKISAPQSASSGQTRAITVYVTNKRYDEYVRVDLYKSVPGGFQWLGAYTQFIPIRSGNRTSIYTFNYTFTSSDASIGKVTFKAVATIVDARDTYPSDNEAISSPPTKVSRAR